jgi:hypothetical protein
MKDAATTDTLNDFTSMGNSLTSIQSGDFNFIHTDWDADIPTARICWNDKVSGVMKVKAAQVKFDISGQPYDLEYVNIISDNTQYNTVKPVIIVNHGISSGDISEAFSSYTHNESSYQVDLNVFSGNDVWGEPYPIADRVEVGEADITYQSFGTSRNIWIDSDNKIAPNSGILDDVYRHTVGAKLCTNRANDREIYCAYKQYTYENQKIMIQQLEP